MRVGVVVPTFNAGQDWAQWLSCIGKQTYPIAKKVVVDSSSTDSTVLLASQSGFEVEIIDKEDFNHGGTRQYALSFISSVDIVIFMTQDAILSTPSSILAILRPFSNENVGAVCGRQLPRKGATPFAAHARFYNYPENDYLKGIEDAKHFGLKTAF
ncbi:MAG: glycosyltransferase family 2 protein, partial [Motiliproteus sp.]|nr:glycosyltransferase family 2 protein [Motiliproteus sp.]